MNVLIVDDEPLARRLSAEYLGKHPALKIVAECDNGTDAVEAILTLNPDLILLDIQMPGLSGLEVLEATGRTHGVIFTTAFDTFALRAFELHAVDYLLKPYSQERFDAALDRASRLIDQPSPGIRQMLAHSDLARIVVRDRNQLHILTPDSIEYIEAQDDYIVIHSQGRTIMKTQTLSDIEAQLNGQQFVRIHRSYLVNLGQVQRIVRTSPDSLAAVLASGSKIPVSRKGYERLRPLFRDIE